MSSSKARGARGESGFTLIDMLFVIALIGLLSTLAIPGLMRARGAAQSASALGTMKVVNSAQLSFAITCGLGFYSPDFQTLGVMPPSAIEAFLPPEMSSGPTFIKSGYTFSMAGGIPGAPASCNGLAGGARHPGMRSSRIRWTPRRPRATSAPTPTAPSTRTRRATRRPCPRPARRRRRAHQVSTSGLGARRVRSRTGALTAGWPLDASPSLSRSRIPRPSFLVSLLLLSEGEGD